MSLSCYRCGESLEHLSLPIARLDLCPACGVELHVCRMCRHYAPSAPTGCDEEDAIEVHEKARANFCDYFEPSAEAFDGREQAAEEKAREALAALFEDESSRTSAAAESPEKGAEEALRDTAEDLFKPRRPG